MDAAVELVKAFSAEGSTIMDCCIGNATNIIATLLAGGGRKAIGSDANPKYVATAKRRAKEFWISK